MFFRELAALAAAFGAFLFGLGMQLGGGCGSGTLYTVGGGSSRMVLTLAAFIAGSVLATAHWDQWQGLPALPPMSLIWTAGPMLALLIALAVLGALFLASRGLERKLHGGLAPETGTGSLLQGPWSLTTGAVALAVMSVLTLIVLERPWGITSAFALWGAKIAQGAGIEVEWWAFWSHSQALNASVFADATSVQDFGLILGAMMAAGLAGKFAPVWRLPLGSAMAAIVGGLLMGYGARLSFGCNIGAFLGGVASGSLHGVGWLVFGLLGSAIGARLRPVFGLN
ncbi:MAG: YeeE/YedE family protein [Rhodomicrobium sp.]|nr:YeeE/YedE family protein [Rhodomicrobium sp.]